MFDLCLECRKVIGRRQNAVSCDACDRWQHRICETDIIQISFVSYFEVDIYLFIYLFKC